MFFWGDRKSDKFAPALPLRPLRGGQIFKFSKFNKTVKRGPLFMILLALS